MTDPEGRSYEEVVYAVAVALFSRHGFAMAMLAPLAVIALIPMRSGGVLVVVVIYLVEAIAYAAIQRRRRSVPEGWSDPRRPGGRPGHRRIIPGPFVMAMSGLLAAALVTAGLLSSSASDGSAPVVLILTVSIALGLVASVWHRAARESNENSARFLGRIGGQLVRVLLLGAAYLARSVVVERIGLAVIVAIGVGLLGAFTLVYWIATRSSS
jgi:hypothetical protein